MSDQGYTPTTEELTNDMRDLAAEGANASVKDAGGLVLDMEAFVSIYDNWIAEVRREAAEKAWDRATDLLSAHYLDRVPSAVDRLERSNPYRKEVTA